MHVFSDTISYLVLHHHLSCSDFHFCDCSIDIDQIGTEQTFLKVTNINKDQLWIA